MPRYFVLFRFIFDYSNMWVILLPVALLAWFIGWKGTKGRCLPAALVGAVVYLACEGSYFLPIQSYSFEFLMIYLGTFGLGAALGFLAAWGMGKIKGNLVETGKETKKRSPACLARGGSLFGCGRGRGRTHRSAPARWGKRSGTNGDWCETDLAARGGTEPAPYRGPEALAVGCAWGVASASQSLKRNLGRWGVVTPAYGNNTGGAQQRAAGSSAPTGRRESCRNHPGQRRSAEYLRQRV